MAEGAGTTQAPPQTNSNGKNKLVFGIGILVHNNDKSSGHCCVKVDIYFAAVGMIDIPTENEILATMEEIRENPQNFRFVA